MANRSHVPIFGTWESGESVPYTAYFEKARKDKVVGGRMINPNDPQENPDAFMDVAPPPAPRIPEPEVLNMQAHHDRRPSREDGGDPRRHMESPARYENNRRTPPVESSPLHRQGMRGAGDLNRKGGRENGGPERSTEQSPMHPHYAARVGNKGGVSSPSWERKGSTEGSATPGRLRLRGSNFGDETPDKGTAVPKFGEWDESDPASADNFTQIFNIVRKEKHTGGKVPSMPANQSNYNDQDDTHKPSIWCCFGK
ncbi:RPM1-interacting protein 4 [Amborella trichopoda]|nr:RPM1-interacting protein 4 [Amborella trichopoda]|eukprot:XP_006830528.2 RPM1-interacting protein 4 [Amborella trichopoda]